MQKDDISLLKPIDRETVIILFSWHVFSLHVPLSIKKNPHLWFFYSGISPLSRDKLICNNQEIQVPALCKQMFKAKI